MKRIYLLTCLFLILIFRSNAQTVYPDCVDGVVYLKIYDSSSVQISYSNPSVAVAQLISDYSITDIEKPFRLPDLSVQHIYKITFSDFNAVDTLINACMAMPYVEYAEKAPLIQLTFQPNDYNSVQQWSLQKINAPAAWNISTGSPSVKIAIVDNGIDYSHVDLVANAWTNPGEIAGNGIDDDFNGYVDDVHGYDVADGDNNPKPPASTVNTSPFIHGTHCAGIASASTNNSIGISSIAYQAKIISVKCSPDTGNGSTLRNAFEGLDYAISAGADVVSMSFGSTQTSLTWQVLINSAQARNIILVAAAGNDNSSTLFYPAAYPYVIAVGATDENDVKASFSNYGSWLDVMAPGVLINSTFPQGDNTYGSLSGTSMACPLVAGLAGLVLSENLNFTESQVETYIKNGCQNINSMNSAYVGQMGSGRIDALLTMTLVTGISEQKAETNFSIYPNPGNGDFWLQTNQTLVAPIKLDVYDFSGKLVSSRILPEMNQDGRVKIELAKDLAPGEYLLVFNQNDSMIETEKLVVKGQE